MTNQYTITALRRGLVVGVLAFVVGVLLPFTALAQTQGVVKMKSSLSAGEEMTITTYPSEAYTINGATLVSSKEEDGYKVSTYKKGNTETIEIRGNLSHLSLAGNSLTELDLSKCPTLVSIYCELNEITTLTLGNSTTLTDIDCSDNKIANIDLKGVPNLVNLLCNNNSLTSLNLSSTPLLESLFCNGNPITSITFKGNTALKDLYAMSNELKSIDFSETPNLIDVNLFYNNLESINFAPLKEVRKINVAKNSIKTLDLSTCTKLRKITCHYNLLSSFTLPANAPLRGITCYGNQISGKVMRQVIAALPKIDRTEMDTESGEGEVCLINTQKDNEKNVCYTTDVEVAKTKNWRITDFNGDFEDRKNYAGTEEKEEPTTTSKITMELRGKVGDIIEVGVVCKNAIQAVGLTEIEKVQKEDFENYRYRIEKNQVELQGEIEEILIKETSIARVNLSACPSLVRAYLNTNGIDEIILGQLPKLAELELFQNKLSRIDLKGCPSLQMVDLSENQLTELDLSHNKQLINLATPFNQIKGEKMTSMLQSLPLLDESALDREEFEGYLILLALDEKEGCKATKSDVKIAKDKHWIVYAEKGEDFEPFEGEDGDAVDAITIAQVRLFPNPAHHYVDVLNAEPEQAVSLTDLSGAVVLSARTNANGSCRIDVSRLAPGAYLLQIGSLSQKLIIE